MASYWGSSPCRRRHRRLDLALCLVIVIGLPACRAKEPVKPPRELRLQTWLTPGFPKFVSQVNGLGLGVHLTAEGTPGSVYIASALQEGRADIGSIQADVAYLAFRRGLPNHPQPHTHLRGIAVMWVNRFYVLVRAGSALRHVSDLRGHSVGLAPAGGSGEFLTRIVLAAYNLTYSDFLVTFETPDKLATDLAQGKLDAVINIVPRLFGEEFRLANETEPLRLLLIEPGPRHLLQSRYPFIRPAIISQSELDGMDADVETLGVDALLVCRQELDDALVYELTKAYFDTQHPLSLDPWRASSTSIPLHPGALEFYRERELVQ